jgi:hypothetical protein
MTTKTPTLFEEVCRIAALPAHLKASSTPRTDAYVADLESELGDGPPCISTAAIDICVRVRLIDFAKKLERELNEVKKVAA